MKEVRYDKSNIERFNRIIKVDDNNILAVGNEVNVSNGNLYNGIIGKYKSDLTIIKIENYGEQRNDYFTDVKLVNDNYLVVGYSAYDDGSYLGKFIVYSKALKVL